MDQGNQMNQTDRTEQLLRDIESLGTYKVEQHRFLEDVGCEGYVLRHRKSGARIAVMPNEDSNKVFYIAFRTPPKDSTGVAHIIEHTVLCGSRDFPVKDPFIEVVKGSLNTFLNAMTYPDKTVYPVASTNEKDFANLMHVYLDAVFHPNIYTNENIFRQEGWHYEVKDPAEGENAENSAESSNETMNEGSDAVKTGENPQLPEIVVNGVVYNEMKGVMSSADDVLNDAVLASLYPDTTYSIVSGGDPEVIPELTYEEYLAFHQRFYHPSNSYIYLYGDMDVVERLQFLDEHYLSQYDVLQVDSAIGTQPPFSEPVEKEKYYSILPEEETDGKTYLSWNAALPIHGKEKDMLAFRVLDYVLCDAEGAPVKEALREKGIGQTVESLYEAGIYEPYYSIAAKFADAEQKEDFCRTIESTLEKLASEGIDPKALLAGINYYEFHYREADFGSYPKGLIYGLDLMDTWLYEEDQVWNNLELGHYFDELKEDISKGYFERMIREYLLENPHKSVVLLLPRQGLTEEMEEEQKARMKTFAESLSAEELQELRDKEASLRAWQNTPDTEEAIASIPVLERGDLKREVVLPVTEKVRDEGSGLTLLTHPVFTSGIDYLDLAFDVTDLPESELRALGVFKVLMGAMDTEHYTYSELDNEINIVTGGMAPSVSNVTSSKDPSNFRILFKVSLKAMDGQLEKALELAREMLLHTDWSDLSRTQEVLEEERASMKAEMAGAGHSTAVMRASAALSPAAAIMDDLSGIGMYRFLDELCSHFEERGQELAGAMSRLTELVVRKERFFADITADPERMERASELLRRLAAQLPGDASVDALSIWRTAVRAANPAKAEGFTTAGQVQFVCRAGDFRKAGLAFHGALRVMKVILGYDYLWVKVRMNGGAYGCMSGFGRDGIGYFVSYRDPKLAETIETYEGAADFIRSLEADEKAMTKYVIGAVSGMDRPMTPSMLGKYSQACELIGITAEDLQRERQQVLDCTLEDIHGLGDYIEAFMKDNVLCVVGASAKLRENEKLFERLEPLT